MQAIILEKQEAEPVDEATHAALDEAEASVARGQILTLEQSDQFREAQLQAWRKTQQEILAA